MKKKKKLLGSWKLAVYIIILKFEQCELTIEEYVQKCSQSYKQCRLWSGAHLKMHYLVILKITQDVHWDDNENY